MRILLFLIFLNSALHCQNYENLVLNPSFEESYGIPCSWLLKSKDFSHYIKNWYPPSAGIPEIYSLKSDTGCFSNCFSSSSEGNGHHYPRTGNNMLSISCYGSYHNKETREYLQEVLRYPLIKDSVYQVRFYVSLCDSSNYACNNIGFLLSDTKIQNYGQQYLSCKPTMVDSNIIIDKLEWIQLSFNYIAKGNERYLTIGNFIDDEHTKSILLKDYCFFCSVKTADYFIDDVSIYLLTQDQ